MKIQFLSDFHGFIVGLIFGKFYFETAPFSGFQNGNVGKYFTPQGRNLAGVGVTPDREIPVDDETAAAIYYGTLEPENDPQIQAAAEYLTEKLK